MESQTSLVRSDCAVELYTVAFIYLNLTIIIYPRNLEGNNTLRLNETLEQADCTIFLLVCIDDKLQRIQYFLYCLMKLRLSRVLCYNAVVDLFCVRHDFSPLAKD